jgi:hypothetical protein
MLAFTQIIKTWFYFYKYHCSLKGNEKPMLKYSIPLIMSHERSSLNQAEAASLFFLFFFLPELEHVNCRPVI